MKQRVLAILMVLTLLSLVGCSAQSPAQAASASSFDADMSSSESIPAPESGILNPEGSEALSGDGSNSEPVLPAHTEAAYQPSGNQLLKGKQFGTDQDYTSLYEQFGRQVTIADVEENEDGLAVLKAPDGKRYELGLDFLSMAMVFNTDPAGSAYRSADEVYAAWWRYYLTRWNRLLPEIPLYCHEYYDICSAQIRGMTEYPTNPWWGPSKALLDWSSDKSDNSLILGVENELQGTFRFRDPLRNSGSNADPDIYSLITGLETAVTDREGRWIVNPTAVQSYEHRVNEDGTATFFFTIYDDLRFSDGSPVTAKNYLYTPMVFSSSIVKPAGQSCPKPFYSVVGCEAFHSYTGPYDVPGETSPVFSGLRLLGDYSFSLTLKADYVPYFFRLYQLTLAPVHRTLWLETADIADDGEGCYLTGDFYENAQANSAYIEAAALGAAPSVPCAGPYAIESWDEKAGTVTLRRNPYFKGDYAGTQPSIETVIVQKVEQDTLLENLKTGRVDFISGIPSSLAETAKRNRTTHPLIVPDSDNSNTVNAAADALAFVDASEGAFYASGYLRAGYGKLAFRNDFGPVQFPEVRQAIALCMDRPAFSEAMTGGLGSLVDAPYAAGSWMYREAVKQGMKLESYAQSLARAVALLEDGGWIYDKDGKPYTEGVRYKKIPAAYATLLDIRYSSLDGSLVTTRVGEDYYMPLVLCWFGTEDNAFSALLEERFAQNELLLSAGFRVDEYLGSFYVMLDELYWNGGYGAAFTPRYNVFNFSTGYSDPVFDYSFNLTIDPNLYDNYSVYYLKDPADIWWN